MCDVGNKNGCSQGKKAVNFNSQQKFYDNGVSAPFSRLTGLSAELPTISSIYLVLNKISTRDITPAQMSGKVFLINFSCYEIAHTGGCFQLKERFAH